MKKNLFLMLLLIVLSAASVNAQVTIGADSDPNPSAVLDLQTSNQGLLLPRVALISTTSYLPLQSHVAGMTVYNTAVAGAGNTAVTPGIYANDGSKWIRLAEGAQVAVAGAPEITVQPATFTFSRLQDANGDPTGPTSFSTTLSVTATGDTPLSYQWYRKPKNTNGEGELISGATTANYDVDISTAGLANWGLYSYYCKVSNAKGTVYSGLAQVALGCGAKTANSGNSGWLSFMCYNLGADPNLSMEDQMAYETTLNTDATVMGDLYQWGRNTDGHEKRTSEVTTTLATNIQATEPAEVIGKFIADGTTPNWVTGISDLKLWDVPKTPNDPCPEGWRVPYYQDIYDLGTGANLYTNWGTYANTFGYFTGGTNGLKVSTQGIVTLFLPADAYRSKINGELSAIGTVGRYSMSGNDGTVYKGHFKFTESNLQTWESDWATLGRSVRCVAD